MRSSFSYTPKTRFTLLVSEDEFAALVRLADIERRPLRDQAALIIRRELERLNLIQKESSDAVNIGAGESSRAGDDVDVIISAALPASISGSGHALR